VGRRIGDIIYILGRFRVLTLAGNSLPSSLTMLSDTVSTRNGRRKLWIPACAVVLVACLFIGIFVGWEGRIRDFKDTGYSINWDGRYVS
jgi:hypothetical protein